MAQVLNFNSFDDLKFLCSEKATNFCKICNVDLTYYLVTVKSTMEILQNFVAFSEYMNVKLKYCEKAAKFEIKNSRLF